MDEPVTMKRNANPAIAYQASSIRWLTVVACVVLTLAFNGRGQAAESAQSVLRAPDVPYEPTPQHVVAQMIELAHVRSNDVVYDLGCGDGRIVIAAAKLGARGVCVDIDPQRILESRANAERAGVSERIVFLNQDIFDTDIKDATVVTLFLWPTVNLKLRPMLLRELAPGTRVVSYVHDMGDWTPQESREVDSGRGPRRVYLWTIARSAGSQRP
jgi:SAM-dependent methyltransferase